MFLYLKIFIMNFNNNNNHDNIYILTNFLVIVNFNYTRKIFISCNTQV